MNFLTKIKHWHRVAYFLVAYDFITVMGAYFLALWFRFDCKYSLIPDKYLIPYKEIIIPYTIFVILVYYALGLYRSIWRFASFFELKKLTSAVAICLFAKAFVVTCFVTRMPISYYVFGIGFQFTFSVMVRFSYRFVLLLRDSRAGTEIDKKVLVIGAGEAGRMIIRDVNYVSNGKNRAQVVAVIDDNPNKWGRYIDGVEVVGGTNKILSAVDKFGINEIYIAISNISPSKKRNLINICKESALVLSAQEAFRTSPSKMFLAGMLLIFTRKRYRNSLEER